MTDNNEITCAPRGRLPVFLRDLLAGFVMGIAFIIPGFSGGSVAAILGIYEKLISAVTDLFRNFKSSFRTLLPIALGLVLGAAALLFPLKAALAAAPLPTVSLFVGLALGGIASITDRLHGKFRPANALALAIPALFAATLCFIPTGADVDLLNLSFGGYALLFLIGILGSVALVVPGISGSMMLLILGYYNPIIKIITEHLLVGKDIGVSVLVIGVTALGIIVGFFIISYVMRGLLRRYPRGTYFAIVGFIVGSTPSAFVSTAKDAGMTLSTLPTSPLHWIACVLLLALGFLGALLFVIKVKRAQSKKKGAAPTPNEGAGEA